jgi:tricorn protease-like protein
MAYYQHPTICGSVLAFVCEDDVWAVDLAPGSSRPYRITTDGCSSSPAFSRNGKFIAYSSFVSGALEVFVVSVEGGPAVQLTHLGADSNVVGWIEDEFVIFTSNYQQVCVDCVSA